MILIPLYLDPINSQKTIITLGNGEMDLKMELANCFSLTKVHIMVSLLMVKPKEMEDYFIQMVIFILDNGGMIKHMDMENI